MLLFCPCSGPRPPSLTQQPTYSSLSWDWLYPAPKEQTKNSNTERTKVHGDASKFFDNNIDNSAKVPWKQPNSFMDDDLWMEPQGKWDGQLRHHRRTRTSFFRSVRKSCKIRPFISKCIRICRPCASPDSVRVFYLNLHRNKPCSVPYGNSNILVTQSNFFLIRLFSSKHTLPARCHYKQSYWSPH